MYHYIIRRQKPTTLQEGRKLHVDSVTCMDMVCKLLKIGHKIILAIKLIKTFKGNNDNVLSV